MTVYDDSHFSPPAPVARVTLRHPDRAESTVDILMLIDSGADATLVPKRAVESLGLASTGERFQVVAFDGKVGEAESVRGTLVFLNKTFRGLYLLTDEGVGILGRDILNHVRLLLDGPARSWQEHQGGGS